MQECGLSTVYGPVTGPCGHWWNEPSDPITKKRWEMFIQAEQLRAAHSYTP